MTDAAIPEIKISIKTTYIDEQSNPEENRFVFAYTINIRNDGVTGAKLLTRTWLITDSNNKVQNVHGDGVVGLQPHILPGESFTYTSGAILETPLGCMQGSYHMITDEGAEFDAPIPVFRLSSLVTMH